MKKKNSVAFFVCGKFHYGFYVKYLSNVIDKIYFSYKIGYSFGLVKSKEKNLFLKEYLSGGHIKIFGRKFYDKVIFFYQAAWKLQLYFTSDCYKIGFFMLHGNCIPAIKKIKKSGGVVVGEAVNAHPIVLMRMILKESEYAGINAKNNLMFVNNKIKEIALLDYLVCPSQHVKKSYCEMGFDKEKIFVIPYGVNSENKILKTRKISKNKTTIKVICVGQVSVRKAQLRMLEVIDELEKSGYRFSVTIVGAGDVEYMKLLYGKGFVFNYISHMKHDDLMMEIGANDVLVLPSIEDGFGMVVTEAIGVGTPVIVSENAGVSELVKFSGGGVVFNPFDKNDFVRAFKEIINGNFPVAHNFRSWKNHADDIEVLINGLMIKHESDC